MTFHSNIFSHLCIGLREATVLIVRLGIKETSARAGIQHALFDATEVFCGARLDG